MLHGSDDAVNPILLKGLERTIKKVHSSLSDATEKTSAVSTLFLRSFYVEALNASMHESLKLNQINVFVSVDTK